ncbi:MAG: MFS transporter [Sphingobacteriales bacterium]|nr:MAG: MFS transporter [Sphingobacteriales bacterium]
MVKTPREEFEIADGPDEQDFDKPSKSHPKGLYLLFTTEMWERFSYYGMRAIFTLYLANALLYDKAVTSTIYGAYTGLVYLTPLLGGYIADRYWGNRKSIIFGGALMAIGQFFMFASGSSYQDPDLARMLMFGGLGFLIFGNGFFKPNISTMVGQLYNEGDRRVDSAFTIFYMGINLGALLGNSVCSLLGEQYDGVGSIMRESFKYGFLAAGIGMVISLISFIFLKDRFLKTPGGKQIGVDPTAREMARAAAANAPADASKSSGLSTQTIIGGLVAAVVLFFVFFKVANFDVVGSFILSSSIVFPALIIMDSSLTKAERTKIWVIYIIAFFVIFFWMAFEQAGASLTFFAQEQTKRNIFGWTMPASLFQIFNAAFIVILAPVFVAIWDMLGRRGKEPSSPAKQSIGLAFLALGYLFIAWGVHGIEPWTKVSMIWLTGLYLIHTLGELCLSPIGLSMVVKLSPMRLVSLLMGVWFLSTASANYLAGTLSSLYPEEVKVEKVSDANTNAISALQASPLDTSKIWNLSAKDFAPLPIANVTEGDKEISTITPTNQTKDVSVYHLKLIRTSNSKFSKAFVSEDGNFIYAYRKDEQQSKQGVKVSEKVEVWNVHPEKPKFAGSTIDNLFDFFMIFVYLSGAAAVILFLLSGRLVKMMNVKD